VIRTFRSGASDFETVMLFRGDDEKKKRRERLKKNRNSIISFSSKLCESADGSDKEMSETVSQTSHDADVGSAAVVIAPEVTVTSVHSSESTVPRPAVSTSELSSETTNLLSKSKAWLGKDGLSSSSSTLSADLMSYIENTINASVTANIVADAGDLMRTLTSDEERVIQELVQVSICSYEHH